MPSNYRWARKVSMDSYQIGDKEYKLEELQGLIEDGQMKREYETKFNTNFENAWSAYGKSQNEKRELQEELEKLKTTPPPKSDSPSINLDEEFTKRGYLSREEAQKLVDERVEYTQTVQNIAGQFRTLEKDLTGEDGRPKFESDKILEYMRENPGLTDPKKAYDLMHLDEISAWKAEQLSKKPDFHTNTGDTAVNKQPQPIAINRDNVDAALREALSESGGKF